MKKIGVYYSSLSDDTVSLASQVASRLGVEKKDMHDVAATAPSSVGAYDVLIMGSSTVGDAALPGAWLDFLDGLSVMDLKGKKVAIFGSGDQTMADNFGASVGLIYDYVKRTGAEIIGYFDNDGYKFRHSGSVMGDKVVGMVIDDVNSPDLTPGRIDRWTALLKKEM